MLGFSAAACDDFPANSAVTFVDGEPFAIFRACTETEAVLGIQVLRWDGSGDDDDDYDEVWFGIAREDVRREAPWPLAPDGSMYTDSMDAPPDFSGDGAVFRVYVRTTERLILTSFKPGQLPDGALRYEGRTTPSTGS